MPRVCVFDVNETLLDLAALDPHFERAIGAAALQMTAERQGIELSDEDQQSILGGMRELPPHPEVAESLDRLRDAGIRIAALTNSTQEVAEAQLNNAGLADKFERILSADTAKRVKPSPAPYRMAARSLEIPERELRLVAAHAWDVAGAMRAGCAAAFVARQPFDPLVERPDVFGKDLSEVTDKIIEIEA